MAAEPAILCYSPIARPVHCRRRLNPVVVRGVLKGVAALRVLPGHRRRVEDPSAAFVAAVHAEHAGALLGHALRLTGDPGRAEDIVQETLLRAWKHAAPLAADARPLRPWLFTVAANLAADDRRARRSRPAELGENLAGDLPAPDELDRAVEAWYLADAVGRLSADHRAVLVETFYRGHTVAEAAQVLAIPVGTVKSRTFYALRALRLMLEEGGGHER